jgi:hypothetical protein
LTMYTCIPTYPLLWIFPNRHSSGILVLLSARLCIRIQKQELEISRVRSYPKHQRRSATDSNVAPVMKNEKVGQLFKILLTAHCSLPGSLRGHRRHRKTSSVRTGSLSIFEHGACIEIIFVKKENQRFRITHIMILLRTTAQ